MAVVEHDRLKAVSVQSPPTDLFFTRKFLTEDLLGNREYLFDQVPALMAIFDNVTTVDDIAAIFEKMSLVKQGILGKPTAPMLIIAGVKDTQVPISDIYELMNAGDIPKEAWINPSGGHLGRQVKVWPDPIIFKRVLLPWIARNLDVPPLPEPAKKSGD
jgi:esterase FrsA